MAPCTRRRARCKVASAGVSFPTPSRAWSDLLNANFRLFSRCPKRGSHPREQRGCLYFVVGVALVVDDQLRGDVTVMRMVPVKGGL